MAKGTQLKSEKEVRLALEATLARVIYQCMTTYPDGFCANEIWEHAAQAELSPKFVRAHIGPFLRSYRRAGLVTKLKEYRVSKRGNYNVLPVYVRSAGQRS